MRGVIIVNAPASGWCSLSVLLVRWCGWLAAGGEEGKITLGMLAPHHYSLSAIIIMTILDSLLGSRQECSVLCCC